jgi:DNA-binding transcriptional ArsR family regulator
MFLISGGWVIARDFLKFVGEAKALNSKVFSLPRLLILLSLEELGHLDGALYRELKAGLELDDGVLYSNLNALKKMGYVTESVVVVGSKKMSCFAITCEGSNAVNAVKKWFSGFGDGRVYE